MEIDNVNLTTTTEEVAGICRKLLHLDSISDIATYTLANQLLTKFPLLNISNPIETYKVLYVFPDLLRLCPLLGRIEWDIHLYEYIQVVNDLWYNALQTNSDTEDDLSVFTIRKLSGSYLVCTECSILIKRPMRPLVTLKYSNCEKISPCKRTMSHKLGIKIQSRNGEVTDYYFTRSTSFREFVICLIEYMMRNSITNTSLQTLACVAIQAVALSRLNEVQCALKLFKDELKPFSHVPSISDIAAVVNAVDFDGFRTSEGVEDVDIEEITEHKSRDSKVYDPFEIAVFRENKNQFKIRYTKTIIVLRTLNEAMRTWRFPWVSWSILFVVLLVFLTDGVGYIPGVLLLLNCIVLCLLYTFPGECSDLFLLFLEEGMQLADPKSLYYLDKDPDIHIDSFDQWNGRGSMRKKIQKAKYKIQHRSKAIRSLQNLFVVLNRMTGTIERLYLWDEPSETLVLLLTCFIAGCLVLIIPSRYILLLLCFYYLIPKSPMLHSSITKKSKNE